MARVPPSGRATARIPLPSAVANMSSMRTSLAVSVPGHCWVSVYACVNPSIARVLVRSWQAALMEWSHIHTTHARARTHAHTHARARTHAHIHTHTHTHTHKLLAYETLVWEQMHARTRARACVCVCEGGGWGVATVDVLTTSLSLPLVVSTPIRAAISTPASGLTIPNVKYMLLTTTADWPMSSTPGRGGPTLTPNLHTAFEWSSVAVHAQ
jgi:hypothetical protein